MGFSLSRRSLMLGLFGVGVAAASLIIIRSDRFQAQVSSTPNAYQQCMNMCMTGGGNATSCDVNCRTTPASYSPDNSSCLDHLNGNGPNGFCESGEAWHDAYGGYNGCTSDCCPLVPNGFCAAGEPKACPDCAGTCNYNGVCDGSENPDTCRDCFSQSSSQYSAPSSAASVLCHSCMSGNCSEYNGNPNSPNPCFGPAENAGGCSPGICGSFPICGDGNIDAGEQCDDDNTTDGDGCSSNCQIEGPRCGDGIVQAGEQCDDGNVNNNDGCSSTCQTERCGDGIKQQNEQCDNGDPNTTDAMTQMTVQRKDGKPGASNIPDAVANAQEGLPTGYIADDGTETAVGGSVPFSESWLPMLKQSNCTTSCQQTACSQLPPNDPNLWLCDATYSGPHTPLCSGWTLDGNGEPIPSLTCDTLIGRNTTGRATAQTEELEEVIQTWGDVAVKNVSQFLANLTAPKSPLLAAAARVPMPGQEGYSCERTKGPVVLGGCNPGLNCIATCSRGPTGTHCSAAVCTLPRPKKGQQQPPAGGNQLNNQGRTPPAGGGGGGGGDGGAGIADAASSASSVPTFDKPAIGIPGGGGGGGAAGGNGTTATQQTSSTAPVCSADLTAPSLWQSYDPSAHGAPSTAKGYFGTVYDGKQYVYFVPYKNDTGFSSAFLRYDSKAPFSAQSSWTVFDLSTNTAFATARGYKGGTFDGRYIYFAPSENVGGPSGTMLRYDTQKSFTDASSWQQFDPSANLGPAMRGYNGATFDGHYVYFVPETNANGPHANVLRYDTQKPFTTASSWQTFNPRANFATNIGYAGGIYDGRYMYFVPKGTSDAVSPVNTTPNAGVLRFDTHGDFLSQSSWTAFSPKAQGIGTDARGYNGGVFDGTNIYFAPFINDAGFHGEVLKYDTKKPFTIGSSWTTFDPSKNGVGQYAKGYIGAVFDGQYVTFAPFNDSPQSSQEVLRYDTKQSFTLPAAWSVHNTSNGVVAMNSSQSFFGFLSHILASLFSPPVADVTSGTPQCSDGIDNDQDGGIDALILQNPADAATTFELKPTVDPSNRDYYASGEYAIDQFVNGKLCTPQNASCIAGANTSFANDAATLKQICRLAGYSTVVSSKGDDFASCSNNTIVRWIGGTFQSDSGCRFPNQVWDLICTGKMTACNDGVDNDGDGLIDYPNDLGCAAATDTSEVQHDADCSDPSDPSESGLAAIQKNQNRGFSGIAFNGTTLFFAPLRVSDTLASGDVLSAGPLCKAAVCGDGILTSNEQCDDGNTKSGDGCSAACIWETSNTVGSASSSGVSSYSASSASASAKSGASTGNSSSTTSFGTVSAASSSASSQSFSYSSAIIGYVPSSSTSEFSYSSYGAQCTGNECANGGATYCATQGRVCNPANTSVCFSCDLRDGFSSSSMTCQGGECAQGGNAYCADQNKTCADTTIGPCITCVTNLVTSSPSSFASVSSRDTLALSITVPFSACGNDKVEAGEECDDGNTRDFDGCSADCLLERGYCGDGVVEKLLDEQCEPSLIDRTLPYSCDDHCHFDSALCGNGVIDPGEQCDAAAQNSDQPNAQCRQDCGLARCGDHIVDTNDESCDDGNRVSGDGCSATCETERKAPPTLTAQSFDLPTLSPPTAQLSPVDLPVLSAHAPVGATGPGSLAVMAAGAATGVAFIRRKTKKERKD